MKNFIVRITLAFLFLTPVSALAQSSGVVVVDCTTGVGLAYSVGSNRPPSILPTGQACVNVTGAVTVTFPTIGAAVPTTGIYNGVNVAGTLRGLSGLSTGSLFPTATAIVDASGNQITTFGGAATTSNASSGVATSSTNQASVVWNYVWNGATWDQATGLTTGTFGSPSASVVSVQGPVTGGTFPTASTPITISATGTTGTVAAALAAASSKTTYICGFSITADAVAGLSGNATVAGVISGTMTYIQGVGVAPAVAVTNQTFNPCVPSSTTNTAITVTSAAASTGGTTAVNAWGYQQ